MPRPIFDRSKVRIWPSFLKQDLQISKKSFRQVYDICISAPTIVSLKADHFYLTLGYAAVFSASLNLEQTRLFFVSNFRLLPRTQTKRSHLSWAGQVYRDLRWTGKSQSILYRIPTHATYVEFSVDRIEGLASKRKYILFRSLLKTLVNLNPLI